MNDAIEKFNIPLPMREITKDDLFSDYLMLRALTTKSMIETGPAQTKTRYDSKWYSSDSNALITYVKQSNVGNKSSDYFHQANRMKCSARHYPSPIDAWNERKHRNQLFDSIWGLQKFSVTRKDLLTFIQMKFYIASQFRPSAAKTLYEFFNAENVLDMSMGWGDRLCGFSSSNITKFYCGTDPNISLFDGYRKQIDYYTNHNTANLQRIEPKKYELIPKGSEDTDFSNYGEFDLAFTSPPYLFVEKYSEHDGQSYKKYPTLRSWLNEYLFTSISNAWKALKSGGIFAINIADVKHGGKIAHLCDPMNEFIATLPNAKYQGMMGYEMAKRPNTPAFELEHTMVEPIWVWRKEK